MRESAFHVNIPIQDDVNLTALRNTDVPFFVQYLNDDLIHQNTLTIPFPYLERHAEHFLYLNEEFERKNQHQKEWVIRKGEEVIGGLGLLYNYGLDAHRSEIGYWLAAPFRGQRLMSTASQCICRGHFRALQFGATGSQCLCAQCCFL